jgi:pyruvate/2-oxoglutarate dehydrogenase complex dihydrolipoamide dehydrogenase (E3) component
MLISGAEVIDAETRMRGHGVTGEDRIDWRDLMIFKRSFTDAVPRNREKDFAENGIDAFHGLARFTGRDVVAVGGLELKARYILIAAGARPVPLNIPGQEHAVTSEGFLELDRLPARLVLVGGGYIAAEFSHITARAGVHVTVLPRAERMPPVCTENSDSHVAVMQSAEERMRPAPLPPPAQPPVINGPLSPPALDEDRKRLRPMELDPLFPFCSHGQ